MKTSWSKVKSIAEERYTHEISVDMCTQLHRATDTVQHEDPISCHKRRAQLNVYTAALEIIIIVKPHTFNVAVRMPKHVYSLPPFRARTTALRLTYSENTTHKALGYSGHVPYTVCQ